MLNMQAVRDKLDALENKLREWFVERDDVALTICDSLVAQMNHLQISEPGMGKSAIVRSAVQAITDGRYFEKQIGEQTPLDEVLGGKSIKALKERDEDERNITGRIADSEYPFMDEIFKGNDTLRSPLLGIINEGLYTNGTQVVNCPLRTLFAASNELPKPNDAFLARFAYRLFVVTIKSRKNFLKFVHQVREKDAPDTASVGLTVAELDAAHEDMKKVRWETEADDTFWQIREAFRKEGLMFNDRTAGWIASKVVPARAWRRGSDIVEAEDFAVLEHCLWNTPKDIPEVKKIIYKISNPVLEEARKAIDSATEAFQNAVNLARQNSDNREQAFGDANKKLNKEVERLDRRLKETQGKAHELLADAKSQVVEIAVKSAMEHGNVPRSVLQTMMEKEMV